MSRGCKPCGCELAPPQRPASLQEPQAELPGSGTARSHVTYPEMPKAMAPVSRSQLNVSSAPSNAINQSGLTFTTGQFAQRHGDKLYCQVTKDNSSETRRVCGAEAGNAPDLRDAESLRYHPTLVHNRGNPAAQGIEGNLPSLMRTPAASPALTEKR